MQDLPEDLGPFQRQVFCSLLMMQVVQFGLVIPDSVGWEGERVKERFIYLRSLVLRGLNRHAQLCLQSTTTVELWAAATAANGLLRRSRVAANRVGYEDV